MADIDSIIAGGAKTNANFDAIAGIGDSYWAGLDQKQKNAARDVFKNGIPTNEDGSPNYSEAAKALYKIGDVDKGNALANLDIQRQQLKLGQDASRAMGGMEAPGGQPPVNVPSVGPSPSRNGGVQVAPAVTGGPAPQTAPAPVAPQSTAPNGGYRGGDNGKTSLVSIIAAQGIPEQASGPIIASIARQLGVDANAPLDINDPRVRNVLAPAIAQAKRQLAGAQGAQPAPQAPGQPAQQQVAQPPQQVAQAVPAQPPAPQPPQPPAPQSGVPPAQDTRGTLPTQMDPGIQQRMAQYSQIMSNPALPQSVRDAAKLRLENLQKNSELTPSQREYAQGLSQGFKGTLADWEAEKEARKTGAAKDAEAASTKYETLVSNGVKAQQEIPQLEMLQQQMEDPRFFSGVGEKYNLLYKRLKSAVGIDPDAAVPQEMLRKVTASNVLSSLGALKGLGQIRVAEINMAREAAASPENSIPANKLLVEIAKRTHERSAEIADMAQEYKSKNGRLDPNFDKQVTAYYRSHPLFTDQEIKDFHKATGDATKPKLAPADISASVANAKATIAAHPGTRDAVIQRLKDNGIDTSGL